MSGIIFGMLVGIIAYLVGIIITLRHKRLDYLWTIQSFEEQTGRLYRKCNHQQATIDSLMFEYCPDDMTDAQLDNYEKHQHVSRTRL